MRYRNTGGALRARSGNPSLNDMPYFYMYVSESMTAVLPGTMNWNPDAILPHLLDRRLGIAGGNHTLSQNTKIATGELRLSGSDSSG